MLTTKYNAFLHNHYTFTTNYYLTSDCYGLYWSITTSLLLNYFHIVSQPCVAATRIGRRASLSIHGPDWTAELIHYAIGNSPPTLQVGRNLHEHRRAGGPFVSPTRDQGRGGPLSPSGQLAEVDVTSGG